MKNIFTRNRKPAPQPETANIASFLDVPVKPVQVCSFCGHECGTEHQFTNGDLYLKRLAYNYLCDACHEARQSARTKHNVANHNTILETPAVPARRKRAPVVAVEA